MVIDKKIEQGDIGKMFENLAKEIGEPVDFQLPDWLSKWKSIGYTVIRRDIYAIYLTTQKVKKRVRVEDDGTFCSCSSTPGSSGVCGVDCHCGMLLSSCSSNCKCDQSCLNKPFHQRPMKKMKIVQTEKCGSGIVAEEDIMQGEFVIEYVGEVIDDKTCKERLWRMKRQGETNFYLCEINQDMVIDATFKGNKSRYINHSCSPNTEMQKWRIDGETRIGIFATRDIKTGDYVTYDYQFMQFGADQDCHCGAVDCRRKLGVKPNKSNAALNIVACQGYKNGVRQADYQYDNKARETHIEIEEEEKEEEMYHGDASGSGNANGSGVRDSDEDDQNDPFYTQSTDDKLNVIYRQQRKIVKEQMDIKKLLRDIMNAVKFNRSPTRD